MGGLVFWLIVLFPIAEVYVLMKVGARIGFWDTLFLLILSAAFGSYLAKIQGKIALQRIQACLQEGRTPTKEMLDGVLVFIGGLLFVFPGFLSDGVGLLLIFPLTRVFLRTIFLACLRSSLPTKRSQGPRADSPDSRKTGLSGHGQFEDAEIIE